MFRYFRRNTITISEPIFIIGVPRSGTTLLRVLLDSHPNIACGPESPWLARTDLSIKNMYQFMANNQFGFVKNYGVSEEVLRQETSGYIDRLYLAYARSRGKSRWAEKTPDHSLDIPFLFELFPHARFIHIVRDGRDVACSTAILSEERKKISPWHSENILLSDGEVVSNTLQNAALRWKMWNQKIEAELKKCNHVMIRYEDLIEKPEFELRRVMDFVGEAFNTGILSFMKLKHDYPKWEWGSTDVKKSGGISDRSIARWRKQLNENDIVEIESLIGDTLIHYGYQL
jgi:hypothetical protein